MCPEPTNLVASLVVAILAGFLLGAGLAAPLARLVRRVFHRGGRSVARMPCGAPAETTTVGFRCLECGRWNNQPCGLQ
jgi:hypothetical protein